MPHCGRDVLRLSGIELAWQVWSSESDNAQKPFRQNDLLKGIEPMSAAHEIADPTALLSVIADVQQGQILLSILLHSGEVVSALGPCELRGGSPPPPLPPFRAFPSPLDPALAVGRRALLAVPYLLRLPDDPGLPCCCPRLLRRPRCRSVPRNSSPPLFLRLRVLASRAILPPAPPGAAMAPPPAACRRHLACPCGGCAAVAASTGLPPPPAASWPAFLKAGA